MNCINQCNICNKLVVSTSVTVVDDTLVINIPTPLTLYYDGCDYCIFVTQALPDTATVFMPVVVTIGTSTTQYPLLTCNCTPVTASMISANRRYKVRVITTPDGGSFRVLSPLRCSPANNVPGLPVAETAVP